MSRGLQSQRVPRLVLAIMLMSSACISCGGLNCQAGMVPIWDAATQLQTEHVLGADRELGHSTTTTSGLGS